MFWFIDSFETVATDGALYLLHGMLIAVSTCGLTLGPRYISATEVSLLILLVRIRANPCVVAIIRDTRPVDHYRWFSS